MAKVNQQAKSKGGVVPPRKREVVSPPPIVAPEPTTREIASTWTFLSNHSHVLVLLHQDSEMVLREVAQRVGITERAVQRIIVDLEADGFIEREKVGRQNRYRVLLDRSLRHPIESHRTIGDLLRMITES